MRAHLREIRGVKWAGLGQSGLAGRAGLKVRGRMSAPGRGPGPDVPMDGCNTRTFSLYINLEYYYDKS